MSEMTEARLAQMDAVTALKAAQTALSEAIDRQWAGGHALRVSIPANPERDTDLIIGGALRDALAYIETLRLHLFSLRACMEAFKVNGVLPSEIGDRLVASYVDVPDPEGGNPEALATPVVDPRDALIETLKGEKVEVERREVAAEGAIETMKAHLAARDAEVRQLTDAVYHMETNIPTIINDRDGLAREVARLTEERDALRDAIVPKWRALKFTNDDVVRLAICNREDADTFDAFDQEQDAEPQYVRARQADRAALATLRGKVKELRDEVKKRAQAHDGWMAENVLKVMDALGLPDTEGQ